MDDKTAFSAFVELCVANPTTARVKTFSQLKSLFIEASALSMDDAVAANSVDLHLWVIESKILSAFENSYVSDDVEVVVFLSSAEVSFAFEILYDV